MDRLEALGPGDPQRIGAYRLLGRLGAGGMGQVYLARSERGRTVAVKLVREELAEQEEFRDRFRQEVQAARQVGGAWTASVLDADTGAQVPWVATAYVAGPSLQQVVSHDYGALPERSVRILAAGLAHAIKDVHAAGIVHRDLKPSNVLVTIDGPRVIDFGIARALETITDGGLTRTGALVGSPGFMAPEQVRGDRITPACDVFCLGSVLAYAATGALPFGTSNSGVHALMFRIAQEEPDLTALPEGLHELVRDCLRKEPRERPTPAEILERTGAEDTLGDGGRTRDPWLPGALVAQLGRHAVQLLDSEDPDGGDAPAPVPAPAPPPPGAPGGATPVNHLPTVVVSQSTPAAPAAVPNPPAYGYPHQAPAYGYPHQGSWSQTPPYGPAPLPAQEPRRTRSSAALVAVALIVALGAGGSVYALMKDDGSGGSGSPQAGGAGSTAPVSSSASPQTSTQGQDAPASQQPTTPTGTVESPSPQSGGDAGAIPEKYLGTWDGAIDNELGHHPRQITIQQGGTGDTVLSMTADGYDKEGAPYHCVFQGQLTSASDSTLRIGGTDLVVAEPRADCAPGRPSTITVLPSGELRRVMVDATGKKQTLTYTKSG
ncbi:serine/threonine-protein kinase [Streptomyces sp. SID8367]|uniref:serine/threonine-protein kinase n=1 Tax=unclassified Streptomyces TaxID=2593676 RepID=UPI000DC4E42E|nr:serine/threonine protein kinase [Streptomyces sp. PsTaAH-137]